MKIKMYLHGSKESAIERAEEMGLDEVAEKKFMYALYEVEFELEVDKLTGDYKILSVKDGDQELS
jgi:poly(3-hydroxybutyrate) depolymerase